jgi:hypothetical protein
MTRERWEDSRNRCLGILFGRATLEDETLLVLINGADRETEFALPPPGHWVLLIDTAEPLAAEGTVCDGPGKVAPHALRVLAAPRPRAHPTNEGAARLMNPR